MIEISISKAIEYVTFSRNCITI